MNPLPWQLAHHRLCRDLLGLKLLSETEGDGRPLVSLNCDPPLEGQVQPRLYPVWAVDANPQQKREAEEVIASFSWGPRKPRTEDAIDNDLNGLPPGRLMRLLRRDFARRMIKEPRLAKDLGEDILGDEPA